MNPKGILSSLNPIALFFGPIYAKEMAVTGRRWSTYANRAGVCLFLLFIISITFLQQSTFSTGYGWSAVQSTRLAVSLTQVIGWTQLVLSAFIGIVSSASAISEEKTNRTIASLASTPLTSGQIVFAKFSSKVSELVLLNLLPIPLLLLLRVFGGIEPTVILAFIYGAIALGVLGAGLSMFLSSWIPRPFGVILVAGFALFMFEFIPAQIFAGISMMSSANTDLLASALSYLCIPIALLNTQFGAYWGSSTGYMPLIASGIVHIAAAFALCGFTSMILRSFIRSGANKDWAPTKKTTRPPRPARPSPRPNTASPKDQPAPAKRPRPVRTKLQSRKVSDRPIFWRESRYLFGISKTLRIVGLSLFAGMMLYLYAWSFSMTEPGLIHYAIPYLYTVILLFVAVFASASLVSGERAARTWDVLLTTPLSLRSILWQKLLGTVYRPSAIIALIIAHFLIFAGPWMPSDYFADPFIIAPGLILILLPWTIALCATGILCSTLAKGSRSAASLNFIVALALWFFIPMVAAIVTETVYGYSSSANEWAQAIVFAINPLALLAGLFEAGVNEFPLEYFLDAYVFDGWDFFAYLLVSALIALAIAWISLELARLRIKRTSGRSN